MQRTTSATGSTRDKLIRWCQHVTKEYPNVDITNLDESFRNGLALCAILHHFHPDLFDYSALNPTDIIYNHKLHIDQFERVGGNSYIEPEDFLLNRLETKSLFTHLREVYETLSERPPHVGYFDKKIYAPYGTTTTTTDVADMSDVEDETSDRTMDVDEEAEDVATTTTTVTTKATTPTTEVHTTTTTDEDEKKRRRREHLQKFATLIQSKTKATSNESTNESTSNEAQPSKTAADTTTTTAPTVASTNNVQEQATLIEQLRKELKELSSQYQSLLQSMESVKGEHSKHIDTLNTEWQHKLQEQLSVMKQELLLEHEHSEQVRREQREQWFEQQMQEALERQRQELELARVDEHTTVVQVDQQSSVQQAQEENKSDEEEWKLVLEAKVKEHEQELKQALERQASEKENAFKLVLEAEQKKMRQEVQQLEQKHKEALLAAEKKYEEAKKAAAAASSASSSSSSGFLSQLPFAARVGIILVPAALVVVGYLWGFSGPN